ncbi:hypothetical protein KY092_14135 [Natronomonas gomsonensis]|uniref:DUF7312 domain-containing protein n=1 Tax=Natronomonas gomsonensis TaxID=1046043 RepID=UPI0020CA28E3|nr:hypothetical protein [Natronomonas gomsonensis]MCY4731693.1 hypothetical protein [Natronomonas gomsonensis]
MNDRNADDADDESWEFSLSDIEQREAEVTDGSVRESEPIEAGDPTLEGTLFFLLGIAFALFIISRLFV